MTTSPWAWSSPAMSLKTMLPLRPVAALLYSPSHSPARAGRSVGEASSRTGDGADAHATNRIAQDDAHREPGRGVQWQTRGW
jgi:hypothetical protein